MFKEIYDYRTMIVSLTKRDLIGRYKGQFLVFMVVYRSADSAGGIYIFI